MPTFYIKREDADLIHYGVLGMKWGVRRYQNPDGSLTSEGKKKYLKGTAGARAFGTVAGNLFLGPLGPVIGKMAETHQIKSNIEKDERRYEREKVSKMSDKELNDFNQRKSLERQLDDILSKEREKNGFDYVKDVLNAVMGGANTVKNITDSAVTLSTPTQQQRQEVQNRIKDDKKNVIAKLEKEKDDKINSVKEKIKGKDLNKAIKDINSEYKEKIETARAEYDQTMKNYNKIASQQLLGTYRTKAGNISQLASMNVNTYSDLAKIYSSGRSIDTSKLSLPELQKLVNRTRAEQQYLDIVTPTNTRDGYEFVGDFLNNTAEITGAVSTTLRLTK